MNKYFVVDLHTNKTFPVQNTLQNGFSALEGLKGLYPQNAMVLTDGTNIYTANSQTTIINVFQNLVADKLACI